MHYVIGLFVAVYGSAYGLLWLAWQAEPKTKPRHHDPVNLHDDPYEVYRPWPF